MLELPKGQIEAGETPAAAAARELCEETGLRVAPTAGAEIATLDYRFDGEPAVHKSVRCLIFEAHAPLCFEELPRGTRALRWVAREEVATLPLRSENLRPVLHAAFASMER